MGPIRSTECGWLQPVGVRAYHSGRYHKHGREHPDYPTIKRCDSRLKENQKPLIHFILRSPLPSGDSKIDILAHPCSFILDTMDRKFTIQDLKNGFNHSIFSTEVSSLSHLDPSPSQNNQLLRISSRFRQQPHIYLKKLKKRKKETDAVCLQALKGTVKAKASLQKVMHNTLICRYQCLKLHQIKNFKQKEKSLISDHKAKHEEEFRQSMGKIRRRKELNELCFSLRKEEKVRNIQALQQSKRQNQRLFRDTIRKNQEKGQKILQEITSRVKQEKAQSFLRKRNLNDLSITRCKFNHFSKINEQLQIIKDYHDQLELFKSDFEHEAKQTKDTALPVFATTHSSRVDRY